MPNAGHNLKGGREGAIATLAAFTQHVASNKPFPAIEWKHTTNEGRYQLAITSSVRPKGVNLWTAESDSKDFRNAEWKSKLISGKDSGYTAEVQAIEGKHVALFGELIFQTGDLIYSLSTQLRRE